MAFSTGVKNAMVDAAAALVTHVGLANSGTELSGGGYARQEVAYGAASGGVKAMTGTETFEVPAGSTVNQLLLRGTATGGTDHGNAPLTEEVFGGAGTYELTALTFTVADA